MGLDAKILIKMSIIYGPVPSWRLGRSLGIDLLSTHGKTCSFDCIYCQIGKNSHPLVTRKEFVSTSQLASTLAPFRDVPADYVTFSGVGEPTLASNLGQAIKIARSVLGRPVAVLTNSSLVTDQNVRVDLAQADTVVMKLDAPDEKLFKVINRPVVKYGLREILDGIKQFRSEFSGKLALQIMFIETNKSHASELALVAEHLSPDEVQINTPLRPCAVKPLSYVDIDVIKQAFFGFKNVFTVYEASKPDVVPVNLEETRRRRPEKED